MKSKRAAMLSTAMLGAIATMSLAASSATAETRTYIVCNRWNECWRVHEHYTTFPTDAQIIYRDDAWWQQHQHDPQWRVLPDPNDDRGWYDKDGIWRPFADLPPP